MDAFKPTYYPEEISEAILSLGNCAEDCKPEELQEALYEIKTIAENHNNSDFWRTLYYALERMTEEHEQAERREKLRRPPRVIVEIKGGAMQSAYTDSDSPIQVELMDFDNLLAAEGDEADEMLKDFKEFTDKKKSGEFRQVW